MLYGMHAVISLHGFEIYIYMHIVNVFRNLAPNIAQPTNVMSFYSFGRFGFPLNKIVHCLVIAINYSRLGNNKQHHLLLFKPKLQHVHCCQQYIISFTCIYYCCCDVPLVLLKRSIKCAVSLGHPFFFTIIRFKQKYDTYNDPKTKYTVFLKYQLHINSMRIHQS